MISNDPLNDGEPQTAAGKFGAEERIEDSGSDLLRHAAARIRNLKPHIVTFGHSRPIGCG